MGDQNAKKILDGLMANATHFQTLTSFSLQPGIYAVYLCGTEPLLVCESMLLPGCLLYIGKTESSQQERDADQHFASGKTGKSTLRRSLGALLRTHLKLVPQPRSQGERTNKRFTNYRFDEAGERCLTEWMTQNLALSFYEYPESAAEIDKVETEIIAIAVPPLNLDKNPHNPHKQYLKEARAECVRLAKECSEVPMDEAAVQDTDKQMHLRQSPKGNKMYLHDAIVDVLRDCPDCKADAHFIAEEIGRWGTYIRPKDNMPPEDWQVNLRAGKPQYSHLFEILGGGTIKLRGDQA